MGSVGLAAWIAKLAFVGLLIAGIASGELRARGIALFLTLGALAWFGLPYLPRGADFVTSALAIIDVALVFVVYRGDLRIT
jgi:hypothetical protein